MQYYSEIDLLEVNSEFQNLKKGKTSVSEYDATFNQKIKLVPILVPTKLSKLNKFVIGLPLDFVPMMKLTTTLQVSIWVGRNVEN